MQNSLIDYSSDDLQKGYRLHRLEVFNWGTFNNKVWKIEPDGANSLLTGDIGSGKSTLVDAILTLLVPHNKIVYNKAAGAESKERTLVSYVRGEYKYQRSEVGNSSVPLFLRGDNEYSVILGRFYNMGYDTGITLAQVFWMRAGIPEKFFIVSTLDLNIKEYFRIFDGEKDVFPLKKRLKTLSDTEVFDTFKDYSIRFRSKFGIKDEKVLELFYQTVSMKSIGKITDFMRNHMLEKFDVDERIQEIRRDYENLTKSYEAVQKAKKQIEQLTPIIDEVSRYQNNVEILEKLKECLNFLPTFFADKKSQILEKEIFAHETSVKTLTNQIAGIESDLERLDQKKDELRSLLNQNKEGQRISQLEKEIYNAEEIKRKKIEKEEEYSRLCKFIGFSQPTDELTFLTLSQNAEKLGETFEEELNKLNEQHDHEVGKYMQLRNQCETDESELTSLERRKTNIPSKNLEIRNLILTNLKLDESELPFVGELIQIKKGETSWEGAIERVLHNFGLSTLVAERFYKEISAFVDQTNLKGKIVYYKVPEIVSPAKIRDVDDLSLFNKIEITKESEFYLWIENELKERYNYVCCESIGQFQRESRAITKNGQIKGTRGRHEKDDLKNIYDRRNYVLGWNNQEKISSIKKEMESLKTEINANTQRKRAIKEKQNSIKEKNLAIHDIVKFQDYQEINWEKEVKNIEQFHEEVEQLKRSSDELKTLQDQLQHTIGEIKERDGQKSSLESERGKITQIISDYSIRLDVCTKQLELYPLEKGQDLIPYLEKFLPKKEFTIKTIDSGYETARTNINQNNEVALSTDKKIREGIITRMQQFKNDNPEITFEILARIEDINEFVTLFDKLKKEDLPRYESRFQQNLRQGTIKDIAIFKNQLYKNATDIKKKIDAINESLKKIKYSNRTYISLSIENVHDADIKDFQMELRDCLENTVGEKNLYTEEKFLQVKKILNRFNSGNQIDINWTNRVTDVRNWFNFLVIEKDLDDDSEKEVYNDSSGKSGGQKEKLAYTILASALAYQFGMADQPKSKSFRFVMIDEAFGRGSDESTRYGLDLFKKLKLQLLIITPLQKIHIIENYINCVHFVSYEEGNSMTRDIPIAEYQKVKEESMSV